MLGNFKRLYNRDYIVFLLRRPTETFIEQAIATQHDEQLTYPHVGLTRESRCPAGFTTNQARSVIGQGEIAFARAKQAIVDWRMLNIGWLQVVSRPESLAPDGIVCTLMRTMGLYSLNVARIVYLDDDDAHRFGFGYGTLPEYPLSGEERFTVSYDPATEQVSYECFSFSQPTALLARLGQPYMRRVQRHFCRDSIASMKAACRG